MNYSLYFERKDSSSEFSLCKTKLNINLQIPFLTFKKVTDLINEKFKNLMYCKLHAHCEFIPVLYVDSSKNSSELYVDVKINAVCDNSHTVICSDFYIKGCTDEDTIS